MSEQLVIQLTKAPEGYLVEGLGGNLDFGMFHEKRSAAWQHFVYLLKNGRI